MKISQPAGTTLSDSAPTQVDSGDAAAAGVSTSASRGDHEHAVATPAAPVDQAFADVAAIGALLTLARGDHRHGMPALTEVLSLAGRQTTEGTTTSLTAVAVVTATVTSIPAATPFLVFAQIRKTAGAAANARIGLRLNAQDTVFETVTFSSNNRAEAGMVVFYVGPRVTNYLVVAGLAVTGEVGALGAGTVAHFDNNSDTAPIAGITSVIITGFVGDALITLGVDELYVCPLPTT